MNDGPCSIRVSTAGDCPAIVAIEHSLGIVWPERRPTPEACPVLETCTAVQNAPMQGLFNKLGLVRDPERLQCQKDME